MGRRYPIEMSGVAWMDLLGYGSMLRPVNFNPSHPDAHKAVGRLRVFQRTAASATTRDLRAMISNDGVAYVRELSPRTHTVTFDFLCRVLAAFLHVNRLDKAAGHPGARMVVAVGPRLRIGGVVRPQLLHLENIMGRLRGGEMSAEEAVREAFRSTPATGSVPQLQANFAFSKAYLADEAGTKAGFGGPNCFADASLFTDPPPPWLAFDGSVDWAGDGIGGRFYRVQRIDHRLANASAQRGIRNAFEIAEALHIRY